MNVIGKCIEVVCIHLLGYLLRCKLSSYLAALDHHDSASHYFSMLLGGTG